MVSRTVFRHHLIGFAALITAPAAAGAQCRLCEGGSGLAVDEANARPVEMEIESSLNFDRLVLMGQGEGTAIIRPDGTRIVSGSLGDFSGTAMVGSAVVRGEPGRTVRIDLPKNIELHSLSGSRLIIDDIVTNLPSAPRLDSTGRLSFRFGGRLRVNGDADGDYRGDLPITADYL
jgi:hypothetical protein